MDTGLVHLHNLLRWVILILLVITIMQSMNRKEVVQRTSLFLMIAAHTMLLIGLYQWIGGRYGMLKGLPEGVESFMKDKFYRFYWLEHPLLMIVSVVLITVARSRAKALRYSAVTGLLLAALALILLGIPWPFREPIGRGWFPGM